MVSDRPLSLGVMFLEQTQVWALDPLPLRVHVCGTGVVILGILLLFLVVIRKAYLDRRAYAGGRNVTRCLHIGP